MIDVQNTRVWGLGGRIGYWPCIRGVFIQVHIGPTRVTAWMARRYPR